MSVLTLQLAGPLQSWGASARFVRRGTESAPTKSGVLGLLASAQGLERADERALARLAGLRFGVRIDQPGSRVRDFQTAHHAVTGKSMPLSERFYLADAVFVAALEGEAALLEELLAALRDPVYPPYLGRRSCPPARPVELGLHHGADLHGADLHSTLRREPWRAAAWYQRLHRGQRSVPLTVLHEALPEEDGDTLRDQPLSFAAEHRRHALRTVVAATVEVSHPEHAGARRAPAHEPFAALEEEEDQH